MKKLILGLVAAMTALGLQAATGPIRLSGKIESTKADNYGLELGTVYDIEDILDESQFPDWGPGVFDVYSSMLRDAHGPFKSKLGLCVAPVGTLTLTLEGDVKANSLDVVGENTECDLVYELIGEGYTYENRYELKVGSRTTLTIKSGTFRCKELSTDGGTLIIEGGTFSVDPAAFVDSNKYAITKAGGLFVVTEKGGPGPEPVSEPEGKIEFDADVLESARAVSSDFDAGFKLSFVADEKTLAEYGTRTVDLALSFASNVVAKTAVFAVKTGSGWLVTTNEEAIAADTVVKILQPAPTLNDVVASGVEFAIGGQTESLRGNVASFSAVLTGGDQPIKLSKVSRTFGHGYFGPDAPEGDPLPITGKDVVAYFKFDDPENYGKNSGISESVIRELKNGAAYTEAGRRGGALVVNSTEPSVIGTLDSPHDWAGAWPNDLQRPPYDGEKYYDRHAGNNAWTIAFWYKPDPATKPAIWEDALAGTLPGILSYIKLDHDFVNLYDGCWHHIIITFNARNWGNSSNPFEVYCDGGHWDVKTGWRESWHGEKSSFGLPATFDAKDGALSIGGDICLFGDGTLEIEGVPVSAAIPFKGVIDDLLILNRWMAPDGAQKLYQTGDAYIFHVYSDVLDEKGKLNSYKNLEATDATHQLFYEYGGRGGWDSHIGWSSFFFEQLHWQLDSPRDYIPEKYTENPEQLKYANGGYDVSYCDYLVDDGSVFMPVSQFGLSKVFMGASLTLGRVDGSTGNFYLYSGNGGHKEITVNDLRLNNGVIKTAAANGVTNLNGSATVNGNFAIVPDSNAAQKLVWSASLAGEDDVTLTIGCDNLGDDLTVMLAGDATAFKGKLDVTAGATLELPVAGAKVDDLTTYVGTQMKALAGDSWVKFVLADNVTLAKGKYLLAKLPKESGSENRFTTNLKDTDSFKMSVEVAAEEAETKVYLVVEEAEPPTPGKQTMVAKVTGVEVVYDGEQHGCALEVFDPSTGWTKKWAWSDTDAFTNEDAMACIDVGVYTNIVKVTADGYYDFYGTGVVTITKKPLEKIVATVNGAEGTAGAGSFACELDVTKPASYTAKWAWSDADDFAHDVPESYTAEGVYTNIVKVTAEGYNDFYGTGIVMVAAAPLPQQVVPGEEIVCETIDEANKVAALINDNKAAYIKIPDDVEGTDVETYLGYLKARVEGTSNKVIVDLDADRKGELREKLDEAFTAESVTGLPNAEATLQITEAIPGLYYWVKGGVEPGVINRDGTAQQATSEKKTLDLAKPDLGVTTKGFFKFAVDVAAP